MKLPEDKSKTLIKYLLQFKNKKKKEKQTNKDNNE